MATRVPVPPPNAPRTGGPFSRWLGRTILQLGGWTIEGNFPDVPRLVLLAAPHSSGWDAFWGLAAKLAMGVDIAFLAKAELFRGPLGWLLRKFGGIPVDRTKAHGSVEQAGASIRNAERMWFVLAPEGTRRRVEHWKSGFWHIARAAGVPVFCAYFHYPDKVIGLGQLFRMSGHLDTDMQTIRDYYRPFMGKHRGTV